MFVRGGWIWVVGTALLLSGCGAIKINELDEKLVSLHQLKTQTQDTEEGPFRMSDAIRFRFAELAKEALEAASKLGSGEQLNKVSLYRIAATARWQSLDRKFEFQSADDGKESGLASTLTISQAGTAVCNEKYSKDAKRTVADLLPRDCFLFDVLPYLEDQDRATTLFRTAELNHDKQNPPDPLVTLKAYRQAYDSLRTSFAKVTEKRNAKIGLAVPNALWRWVDRQRFIAYCEAATAAAEYSDLKLADATSATKNCRNETAKALRDALGPLRASIEKSFANRPSYCKERATTLATWDPASVKPLSFSLPDVSEPASCPTP